MKTVIKELPYEQVLALRGEKSLKPIKPGLFWRTLMRVLSRGELKKAAFTATYTGMEKLGRKAPCLILMNHSCFTDLLIAQTVFAGRPMNIVCTSDGFVGKRWLMRRLGCIPTNKFVTDFVLVRNMKYAIEKLRCSVLMYPEASYSFDGTATPLPDTLGKCLKLLGVPVVLVRTYGAFAHDPLYNNLQKRRVRISADVRYFLSPQEIREKSVSELNGLLKTAFTFDNWQWQRENNVRITEPFRADFLNRVLYTCCSCGREGRMRGKGTRLTCTSCGAVWELTELGSLEKVAAPEKGGESEAPEKAGAAVPQAAHMQAGQKTTPVPCPPQTFRSVPEWFAWQRERVRQEIASGSYSLTVPVEIYLMVNTKAIYHVGEGTLSHSAAGFVLDGCGGRLHYEQGPRAGYSLYSDYYWYEIGDMICIGTMKILYYCIPKQPGDIVAKARIATEELYKLCKERRQD